MDIKSFVYRHLCSANALRIVRSGSIAWAFLFCGFLLVSACSSAAKTSDVVTRPKNSGEWWVSMNDAKSFVVLTYVHAASPRYVRYILLGTNPNKLLFEGEGFYMTSDKSLEIRHADVSSKVSQPMEVAFDPDDASTFFIDGVKHTFPDDKNLFLMELPERDTRFASAPTIFMTERIYRSRSIRDAFAQFNNFEPLTGRSLR